MEQIVYVETNKNEAKGILTKTGWIDGAKEETFCYLKPVELSTLISQRQKDYDRCNELYLKMRPSSDGLTEEEYEEYEMLCDEIKENIGC